MSTEPRINDRIRVPEVRLVGPSGEQVGIVPLAKALELAQEYDLDLVEVAATARPPVCKLMDYGKFKYESAMKAREARKNQAHTVIKEMKLRPKIDPHDYDTKKGHVVRFLKQGDKVKITIMFRGREQSRPELGFRLLQRLADDVQDLGFIESSPKQDGRNMIMVLGPHKKKTEAMAEARAIADARKAERQGRTPGSDAAADSDEFLEDQDDILESEDVADDLAEDLDEDVAEDLAEAQDAAAETEAPEAAAPVEQPAEASQGA
ncbi:translation initiation factor IF-3 [Kitasatospora purpeofusca]|uniref:translation initiation factor IF-3 n=1 Tax=Kitasatospora purpeofusca TaxID=67352 RepID=UPI00324E7B8B